MSINRGDMPATGNNLDSQTAGCMSEFQGGVRVDDLGRWQSGITIREQMASTIASGMVSTVIDGHVNYATLAADAVTLTDTLLSELERTK